MPKKLRQFEIGGIYHVINRGVDKRDIFMRSQDYSRFILALEFFNNKEIGINIWKLVARAGPGPARRDLIAKRINNERNNKKENIIELLAFTLMPNHYHLIIKEIKKGGISLFMNKMGGYSTYFNKQNNRVGPLFQGRYKAITIESDSQLMTIFNYVHTNPVEIVEPDWKDLKVKNKKNAINYLHTYKWSSFNDYIGKIGFPHSTQRDFYLDFFGGEKECQAAVEDWIKFKADNVDLELKNVC